MKRLGLSIRNWMLALVLLAGAPLLALAVYSMWQLVQTERAAEVRALTDRAHASAIAVGQRLNVSLAFLWTLATSDSARRGDFQTLYAFAKRSIDLQRDASAVSLLTRDGRVVFLTLLPYGSRLGQANDLPALQEVFDSGRPVVSMPFKSPVEDRWVIAIGVPVVIDGKVDHCLRLILPVDSLNAMLEEQRLPEHWYATLVHNTGAYVARSHAAERFIGQAPGTLIVQALGSEQIGAFESVNRDGVRVLAQAMRVPSWGLHLVVAVPLENLTESSQAGLHRLLIFGLTLIAASLLAAWSLSNWISARVSLVLKATQVRDPRVDRREPRTGIHEIDLAVRRIGSLSLQERAARTSLDDLMQRHEQTHQSLRLAQLDGLTGLLGRAAFFDAVQHRHEAAQTMPSLRMALLFLDLDGFKGVNDSKGHEAGDRVLRLTADVLRQQTRADDLLGRVGGDEFVVCVQADTGRIETLCADIAGRIVEQVRRIGRDMGAALGCSIGVAIWPAEGADLASVLKRADEAMYEAKRAGKDRFVLR